MRLLQCAQPTRTCLVTVPAPSIRPTEPPLTPEMGRIEPCLSHARTEPLVLFYAREGYVEAHDEKAAIDAAAKEDNRRGATPIRLIARRDEPQAGPPIGS